MKLTVYFLVATILAPCVSLAEDAALQKEAGDLFAQAATRQGLRSPGDKPYILRIRFHADHIVPKPIDGQYEEIWISPDQWRRQFVLSGFKQVEIGTADSKWVSRNLDFRPQPAYLLAVALDAFIEPKRSLEEKFTSIRRKKNKGSELRCVELETDSTRSKREFCFDDSGLLVSEEYVKQRFEYADFGKFGEKSFPRSIRIYEDDRKVLELSAEDPTAPAEPRPEVFQPDGSARQFAPCERWPAIPTKKVPPQYPREARDAHQQGTVTVYAVVAGDGRVGKTKVIESAGPALDQASLDAVGQWVYAPVSCGTHPLDTEIEVRVNYALSRD
ncbi:MAG TPA: energy transducer TonB [Candidatus Dormibacteraeota bacterium]|nr:energy transducer TonB [Candidatus Dormibacteraeota bacterium]